MIEVSYLTITSFVYLIGLLVLIGRSNSEPCYSPIKRGHSKVKDYLVFSNNTFATMDFLGNYRIYSPDQKEPIFHRKLSTTLFYYGYTTIEDGVFISDSEFIIMNSQAIFTYNLNTYELARTDTYPYGTSFKLVHSLKAPGLPIIITKKFTNELGFYFYERTSSKFHYAYNGYDGTGGSSSALVNRFFQVEMSTGDFSALNQARVYYTLQTSLTGTKKVFYTAINASTNQKTYGKWTDTTTLSMNSKVVVHPTDDLVAFSGIIDSNFLGVAFFTDREFSNTFSVNLDNYYDFGGFVPGQNRMVVNFQGGKMCFLDYDLGTNSGSLGACKPSLGIFLEPKAFFSDKMLAIHESKVVLFSALNLDTIQVYSAQPAYSRMIFSTQYQYHVYPNYRLRIFDIENIRYVENWDIFGNFGSILSSRDPMNAMFSYIVRNNTEIVQFNFLKNEINLLYEPFLELQQLPTLELNNIRLTDREVKGIDFYFNRTNQILITIEVYRIDDGLRDHYLVQWYPDSSSPNKIVRVPYNVPIPATTNIYESSVARRFRMAGAMATTNYTEDPLDSSKVVEEEWYIVTSGLLPAYYTVNNIDDISLGLTLKRELKTSIYLPTYWSSGYKYGVQISDPFYSSRTLGNLKSPMKGDIPNIFSRFDTKHLQDQKLDKDSAQLSTSLISYHFRGYQGLLSNCLDIILPIKNVTNTNDVPDPKIIGQMNCFGANIERWYVSTTNDVSIANSGFFTVFTKDLTGGVGLKQYSSSSIYVVTTEDTYYYQNESSTNCLSGIDDEFMVGKIQNFDNCTEKTAFSSICKGCGSTEFLDENGVCQSGQCPIPLYKVQNNGTCNKDCPHGSYKNNFGGSFNFCNTASQGCSFGRKIFADQCLDSCPADSTEVSGECFCDNGMKATETGQCIADCQEGETYYPSRNLCLQSERTIDEMKSTVIDGVKTILCPADFFLFEQSTGKCISIGACPASKLTGINSYGVESCMTEAECLGIEDSYINRMKKRCVKNCDPEEFLDIQNRICSATCVVFSQVYNSRSECFEICGECKSCLQDFFLNSTSQCQRQCQEGEFWTSPNNCEKCEIQCHSCSNQGSSCLVYSHDSEIFKPQIDRSGSDISFRSYLFNFATKVLQEEDFDLETKNLELYSLSIDGVALKSKTIRVKNYFVTQANLTVPLKTGFYEIKISHREKMIGSENKIGLLSVQHMLSVYLENEDEDLKNQLKTGSKWTSFFLNLIQILGWVCSLFTIAVPFDLIGAFFRFNYITRMVMRLRYLDSFFGSKVGTVLSSLKEQFGFEDSGDYIILNQLGYKPKFYELRVGILFFNQLYFRMIFYFLSQVLRLTCYILRKLLRKKGQDGPQWLSIFDLVQQRIHHIVFNVIFIDVIFFGLRTLSHARWDPDTTPYIALASASLLLVLIDVVIMGMYLLKQVKDPFEKEEMGDELVDDEDRIRLKEALKNKSLLNKGSFEQEKEEEELERANDLDGICISPIKIRDKKKIFGGKRSKTRFDKNFTGLKEDGVIKRRARNGMSLIQRSRTKQNTVKEFEEPAKIPKINSNKKTTIISPFGGNPFEDYALSETKIGSNDIDSNVFCMVFKLIFIMRIALYQIFLVSLPMIPYMSVLLMLILESIYFFLLVFSYSRVFQFKSVFIFGSYVVQSGLMIALLALLSIFSAYDLYKVKFDPATFELMQSATIFLIFGNFSFEILVLVANVLVQLIIFAKRWSIYKKKKKNISKINSNWNTSNINSNTKTNANAKEQPKNKNIDLQDSLPKPENNKVRSVIRKRNTNRFTRKKTIKNRMRGDRIALEGRQSPEVKLPPSISRMKKDLFLTLNDTQDSTNTTLNVMTRKTSIRIDSTDRGSGGSGGSGLIESPGQSNFLMTPGSAVKTRRKQQWNSESAFKLEGQLTPLKSIR